MFKKYPRTKWALSALLLIIILIISFGYWFFSLLPEKGSLPDWETTMPTDIAYLNTATTSQRGKILMVVTSSAVMGSSGKSTGYELTELSRPYYVFQANGFEVDIASPQGGRPPAIIDDEDMGPYDYAFLNDTLAQFKLEHTLAIQDVKADAYEAVFFVGGKGAMYDFPNNTHLQSIVAHLYENEKVVGAVCHGPAALTNVRLSDGSLLVNGKKVSAFTNEEELFLIPKAAEIFPFLLEDKLKFQGAEFVMAPRYLQQVSIDNRLVTGQNPWSTWRTAESVIQEMGYTPRFRKTTPQENSIQILMTYSKSGKKAARDQLISLMKADKLSVDRFLLAQHCLVGGMELRLGKTIELLGLLRRAKKLS